MKTPRLKISETKIHDGRRRETMFGCGLILSYFLVFSSFAQEIDSFVGEAPTNFQTTLNADQLKDRNLGFSRIPSSKLNSTGASGQSQTWIVRGGSSEDVGVSLEGIPLNLPSEGYFNFGDFSFFGTESSSLVRGAYSPFSSQHRAHLRIHLPRQKQSLSRLSLGSFAYVGAFQQVPNASLSFERGENDYLYEYNGVNAQREHNAFLRSNIRVWHRKESYQVWGHFGFSKQEIPSDLIYQFSPSELTSWRPILAYQAEYKSWNWAVWGSLQHQEYKSGSFQTDSTTLSSGQKIQHSLLIKKNINLKNSLQLHQDHLSTSDYDSELRHTLVSNHFAFWEPLSGQLLHPQLRLEYVSDLSNSLSVQPALGGRHLVKEAFTLLWNLSSASRVPTLVQRHFRTDTIHPNPDLRRQQSWMGDIGYEIYLDEINLRFVQAYFIIRTEDLIRYDNSQSMTRNLGTSINMGIENELELFVHRHFELQTQYTWMHSSLEDKPQVYVPSHSFFIEPSFLLEKFRLSIPLSYRSSVETFSSPLSSQVELSTILQAYWRRLQFEFSAHNLLRWNRIETEGMPLPKESWYRLSISLNF